MTARWLPAQTPPLGNWLTQMQFAGPWQGCTGSQERFYSVHSSVIPVGPHKGKILLWDRSSALVCSMHNGVLSGDRDQRWAILDPIAQSLNQFAWTIPATAAPPVFRPIPAYPTITHGCQGLFCSGHCWLPDGRLLVVGGDDWSGPFNGGVAAYTGSRLVCIYDPMVGPFGTWTTLTQLDPNGTFLEVARWYPSALVIYDPTQAFRAVKILVLGGIEENGTFDDMPPGSTNGVHRGDDRGYLTHEAYDVVAGANPLLPWTITKDTRQGSALPPIISTPIFGLFLGPTSASSVSLPYFPRGHSLFFYPRAHYVSNSVLGGANFPGGLCWSAGMATESAWVDHPVAPNVWNPPHPPISSMFTLLEEPTALLLPASLLGGGDDRIAMFGGQHGLSHTGTVTADVHIIDTKAAAPTWSTNGAIPAMNHARKFANSVLLPDGSLLITGGGTNPQHGSTGGEVYTPEVFRGAIWEDCKPEISARTYHSGALLLPDARVASIGGDTCKSDLQVFEPHYFAIPGARPSINLASLPATIAYATGFNVGFTLEPGRSLQKACLIAPGSVTHGHDPNQRLVELTITNATTTSATLTPPASPTKAPYGHYMLFLVDSLGAVSTAAWIPLM